MSTRFTELDFCETPVGALILRRRVDPVTQSEVFEVKLGEDFLMSSLFTAAEIALATHALTMLSGQTLDVVVGGLGLGYTATAVLADPRVRELVVIEKWAPVISWHERMLVPASVPSSDRTRLIEADFFAMAAGDGFDPIAAGRVFDAVLLDVDHSPRHVLDPSHSGFYTAKGAGLIHRLLRPGGVFAVWSNDPPDDEYLAVLEGEFAQARSEVVEFPNPLQSRPLQARSASNTLYLAQPARD